MMVKEGIFGEQMKAIRNQIYENWNNELQD